MSETLLQIAVAAAAGSLWTLLVCWGAYSYGRQSNCRNIIGPSVWSTIKVGGDDE